MSVGKRLSTMTRFKLGDPVAIVSDSHLRRDYVARVGMVTAVRKVYFDVEIEDRGYKSTRTYNLENGHEKGEFCNGRAVPVKAWEEREQRALLREKLSKHGVILRFAAEDMVTGLDVDQLTRMLAIVEEE